MAKKLTLPLNREFLEGALDASLQVVALGPKVAKILESSDPLAVDSLELASTELGLSGGRDVAFLGDRGSAVFKGSGSAHSALGQGPTLPPPWSIPELVSCCHI